MGSTVVIPPGTSVLKKYAQPTDKVPPEIPNRLLIVPEKLVLFTLPDIAIVSDDASEPTTIPKTSAFSAEFARDRVNPASVIRTTLPIVIPVDFGETETVMALTDGAELNDTVLVNDTGPVNVTGVATDDPCLIVYTFPLLVRLMPSPGKIL